jgi:SAM-dependent MidA family methyltransferase
MAHEFVDALPVHQFVRVAGRARAGGGGGGGARVRAPASPHPLLPTSTAWRERLIDTTACGTRLRWVLAPGDTPATRALLPRRLAQLGPAAAALDALEICPAGSALAADLAVRVAASGGSALLVDYGRTSPPYADSLVAIARHAGVDPLTAPGAADLSARVDFGGLADAVGGAGAAATAHGPISQASLLAGLGIAPRLQALIEAAPDDAAAEALHSGAARLVAPSADGGMGEAYLALAIAPSGRAAPVPFDGCGEGGG